LKIENFDELKAYGSWEVCER